MADPAGSQDQGRRGAPRAPFRGRSRAVAWAKVLLPLAALGLLSTLFLVAKAPSGLDAVPFARAGEVAREERVDAPRLAGVAADGTRLALAADRLRPLGGDAFALDAPRLEAAGSGGALSAAAPEGRVDGPGRRLDLSGGVRVEAEGGLSATAPALAVDLRAGTLEAAGPVAAAAPWGEIAAGGLRGTRAEGGLRLVFNGGVRLLYRPETPEGAE